MSRFRVEDQDALETVDRATAMRWSYGVRIDPLGNHWIRLSHAHAHPHLSAAASASTPLQCSVLLKSALSALRTPTAALDRLVVSLPHHDAPKLQLTLHCVDDVRKTYWVACNAEPEVRTLALDRGRFPSRLAIRLLELDFGLLLFSHFQSSLQDLTVIATEPGAGLPDVGVDVGGKAIELRIYIDHTKDDWHTRLHTQLWIDPAEFLAYVHTGDPVEVTFRVKELKAFLILCARCKVDILLFFEKAGEPVLLVPKFAMDDGSNSDFDATLVLATMLAQQWSELSEIVSDNPRSQHHLSNWVGADEGSDDDEDEELLTQTTPRVSKHHPSNWVCADEGSDDDEDEELLVQTTPHYMD